MIMEVKRREYSEINWSIIVNQYDNNKNKVYHWKFSIVFKNVTFHNLILFLFEGKL